MPTLDVAINALRAKHGAQQFDAAVKKIKRGSKEVDKSTKSNEKSFKSLGTQMKTVVVGMVGLAAAYKGLRFAQVAVKEIVSFEMELANVSTMLDEQTIHYLPGYEGAWCWHCCRIHSARWPQECCNRWSAIFTSGQGHNQEGESG